MTPTISKFLYILQAVNIVWEPVLQPVMCYGTAKSLIMCFRRHEIYIIFIGKCFMEVIQTHIHMLFYFQATFGDG